MDKIKRALRKCYLAVKGIVVPPGVVWPTFKVVVKKSLAVVVLCLVFTCITAVMDLGIGGLISLPLSI